MTSYMGYLPSTVRYSKSLSMEAKLLYAELTAMCGIDGRCKFDYDDLSKLFTRNRTQIKALLNSLYLIGVISKDDDGFIVLVNTGDKKKTMLENVDTDFIDKVIAYWNTVCKDDVPNGIRRTPALTKSLTERQVSYSDSEIMAALGNRHDFVSNNDWHSLPENKNHKNNIMITLRDDDSLQKYLNLSTSKSVKSTNLRRETIALKEQIADKSLLE